MTPKYKSYRTKWEDDLYSKANIKESYIIRIVVEGAQTEKKFFRDCVQTSPRIHVQVLPPEENQSGPEKLFDQIVAEIQQDIDQSNRQPADQNWIVCDVDEHPYLEQTIEKIDKLNAEHPDEFPAIQIAISNPCFEVWLALYKKRNLRNKTPFCSKEGLRTLLLDIDPNFSKTRFNTSLFQRHTIAINQAKDLDINKSEPIPERPGTRVYRILEEILKIEKQSNTK